MAKTVTATEAKNRLGALMTEVLESNEPIIVELRGQPRIAMITMDRLAEIEEIERRKRHEQALAALDALNERIAAQGNSLSEDEAMELAVMAVREIRADRAAKRRNESATSETEGE